ncbi:MAG: hypothetical protein BWY22_02104 [Bacteroidetes bacterium ADurb.Bin217]|nr:MAG: hypothetical protein BWY22_02104 [Bacteroidetes bacterium ADurb.Bin217]
MPSVGFRDLLFCNLLFTLQASHTLSPTNPTHIGHR